MLHSSAALGELVCDGLGSGLAKLSCTCGLSLNSEAGGVTPHFSQQITGLSIQASNSVSRDHSIFKQKNDHQTGQIRSKSNQL